jgi:hypothetical protein
LRCGLFGESRFSSFIFLIGDIEDTGAIGLIGLRGLLNILFTVLSILVFAVEIMAEMEMGLIPCNNIIPMSIQQF